jgi:hypothetical protein
MVVEAVAHHRGHSAIRQTRAYLPAIPEAKANAVDPALDNRGEVERETVENRLGNTAPTGLVAGQLALFEHEDLLPGLA